ncbi:hypothetical protein EK21DRAFT_11207, partial [Setomelanomma holmii]
DHQLPYETLSYCWGFTKKPAQITLLDASHDPNFFITRNLEEALRALRHPYDTRRLWIDAICINQMEPEERTHQVKQMNLIYKSAKRVIVWLGATDQASKIVSRSYDLLSQKLWAW